MKEMGAGALGRPARGPLGVKNLWVIGLAVAGLIGRGDRAGNGCRPGLPLLVRYWALASVPTRGLESWRAKESAK